jgi:hypothetical protein
VKKTIMQKWVKALRSGKYKQAQELLRKVDRETGEVVGHCCLGVLCDLYRKEKRKGWSPRLGAAYPSDTVASWAGMDHWNPKVDGVELAQLNDAYNKSFAEIADIIEANYKTL